MKRNSINDVEAKSNDSDFKPKRKKVIIYVLCVLLFSFTDINVVRYLQHVCIVGGHI